MMGAAITTLVDPAKESQDTIEILGFHYFWIKRQQWTQTGYKAQTQQWSVKNELIWKNGMNTWGLYIKTLWMVLFGGYWLSSSLRNTDQSKPEFLQLYHGELIILGPNKRGKLHNYRNIRNLLWRITNSNRRLE